MIKTNIFQNKKTQQKQTNQADGKRRGAGKRREADCGAQTAEEGGRGGQGEREGGGAGRQEKEDAARRQILSGGQRNAAREDRGCQGLSLSDVCHFVFVSVCLVFQLRVGTCLSV